MEPQDLREIADFREVLETTVCLEKMDVQAKPAETELTDRKETPADLDSQDPPAERERRDWAALPDQKEMRDCLAQEDQRERWVLWASRESPEEPVATVSLEELGLRAVPVKMDFLEDQVSTV